MVLVTFLPFTSNWETTRKTEKKKKKKMMMMMRRRLVRLVKLVRVCLVCLVMRLLVVIEKVIVKEEEEGREMKWVWLLAAELTVRWWELRCSTLDRLMMLRE